MKNFTIDTENNIILHVSRKAARETGARVFSTEEQFADTIGNDNQRLLDIWNSLPGVKPVTKFANRKTATERIWRAIQNLGGAATAQEPPAETEVEVAEQQPIPESSVAVQAGTEPATPFDEPVAPVSAQAADVAPADAKPTDNTTQTQEPPTTEPEALAALEVPEPTAEQVASLGAQGANVATTEPTTTKKATRAKKTPTDAPKAQATREGSKTDTILGLLKRPGGASLKEIMEATSWQAHSVRGFVSGMLTKKMGLTVVSAKSETGERTYSINA